MPSRLPVLAFAVIAAAVLAWTAYVLTLPDPEMIGYLNDDAFYYLVPAHSFAHGEGWTFDGVTRTSGFQFLYGYLAALASLATGYTRGLPIVMTLSSAAALLLGVWLLLHRARQLYTPGIAAAATLLTLASPRAFLQITAGLEWGWSVLMTAWFVWAITRPRPRLPRRSAWATPGAGIVALSALLTVLTRIDLSIFVAIFAVSAAITRWRAGAQIASARLVATAGAGAMAAIAITLVNSWAITGQWVPNSVRMKQFWSSTNVFLPAISWNLLLSNTGPGAVITSLQLTLGLRSFLVGGFFFGVCILLCIREWQQGAERRALAVGSTVAIAAFSIAYARGVNMMADHYSAGVFVPIVLLTCAALTAARRYWPAIAGILAAGVLVICTSASWQGFPAHLVIARHAGSLFATVPGDARVAGWNAGIAGWRTRKRVMNLDGLANASVVGPIQSGTLACYLADQRISHIMDFGFMFAGQIDTGFSTDEPARRRMLMERNGYDPAALYRCVTLTATAEDDTIATSRYRLFATDQDCLATLCNRPE